MDDAVIRNTIAVLSGNFEEYRREKDTEVRELKARLYLTQKQLDDSLNTMAIIVDSLGPAFSANGDQAVLSKHDLWNIINSAIVKSGIKKYQGDKNATPRT